MRLTQWVQDPWPFDNASNCICLGISGTYFPLNTSLYTNNKRNALVIVWFANANTLRRGGRVISLDRVYIFVVSILETRFAVFIVATTRLGRSILPNRVDLDVGAMCVLWVVH